MERIMEKMHDARLQRNKLQNNAQTTARDNLKSLSSSQKLSWLTGGIALGAIVVAMMWLIGAGGDANRHGMSGSVPDQLAGLPAHSTAIEEMREGLVNLAEQVKTLTASVADLKNTLLDIRTETHSLAGLADEGEIKTFQQHVDTPDPEKGLESLPDPAAAMVGAAISEDTDADTPVATTNNAVSASIEHTPANTKTQKQESDRYSGPWAINLASFSQKEKAERFVEKAESRGIDAGLSQVTVRGKEYWRVHISGFATAAEAEIKANQIKEMLGLKDVWVAKK
jgi:cell division septation protein DedD